MRDIDSIKPDVAFMQRGAKAGRLAVLASMVFGFAFVAPQALNGQTRAHHQHERLTTRQVFEQAGRHYAGPALEEWAAKSDDDDLQTVVDAAQLLDVARFAAYLWDEFGVRTDSEAAARLDHELRYFKRFKVLPPFPIQAVSLTGRSPQAHFRDPLSAVGH